MSNQEIDLNILLKLIIEYWRLLRSYDRAIRVLPPDSRFLSVARNGERRLEAILTEAKLTAVSYEGQSYSPNLSVTVINADEFEGEDELLITQMIEPTIIKDDSIVSIGKAMVGKKTMEESSCI